MPDYKYSRDDYYRLTNAPCLDVAMALGMEINEKGSDKKSWKMKGEQGLCIYREGNNWYRFSDGRHGFPIDLVKDKLLWHSAADFSGGSNEARTAAVSSGARKKPPSANVWLRKLRRNS